MTELTERERQKYYLCLDCQRPCTKMDFGCVERSHGKFGCSGKRIPAFGYWVRKMATRLAKVGAHRGEQA